ncbi:solute carrier family 13 member 2-like [Macrobrachium nipponense]|uniref:solute carrier family 13 member 2-like n=1 Tax=Macrobrachium nipponense TaxID=159736 RepID=UPI0030C7F14C
MPSFRTIIKMYWKTFLLVLSPIIFAALPIISATNEAKCGYVMIMMAIFWMTEIFPLAVTALIPVFAFPFLGILPTGEVTRVYMKENIMMFIGGVTIAVAVEHCNLHKRIALFVIFHLGQSPRRLMAGFMLTTMFLSMWISNTATTAMMVRVVDALLVELFISSEEVDEAISSNGRGHMELQGIENGSYIPEDDCESGRNKNLQTNTKGQKVKEDKPRPKTIAEMSLNDECRALKDMCFLAVAYSANVGGTGSMTGTGSNLVLKGILESSFDESTGLNFATWMAFNIPGMLLCVILAWIWLQILFMGLCRKGKQSIQETSPEKEAALRKVIEDQYQGLGPMSHQEKTVLTLFIILVLMWLFRSPEFIPGWADLFKDANGKKFAIKDASSVILIIFALFALPANLSFFKNIRRKDGALLPPAPGCLNWKVAQERVPWGLVLVMGGGLALAEGCKKSGLSSWMGEQLTVFDALPKEATVFCVSLLIAMLTEVTSNTATASIFLPVLMEMALNVNVNPLYLMLPATVCCSYAFMLPVATPPNAIVYGAADMKSSDMMKAGFVMNVLCVIVITGMINTLGVLMFDLHTLPAWAKSSVVS